MSVPSTAGPPRVARVALWRRQHASCFSASLRQLARRPLGSGLTILVMGLALALPLAFYLLLGNVQHLATALGNSQSINVFLETGSTADAAEKLAHSLRAHPGVAAVTMRTPQQGLAELASIQGFGTAIRSLPHNPLPYVLLVEPRPGMGRAGTAALVKALRAMQGVDLVQDNGQWRARLDALLALGERLMVLLAVLLAAAALLVVGNTVRLNLRGRANEIAVQQLIGASPAFVRRPYLYEGAAYGLAAGLVAVLLVLLLEAVLAAPVQNLVASYAGQLQFGGLSWVAFVIALAIAVVLGWLGAWLATSRQLARLRP